MTPPPDVSGEHGVSDGEPNEYLAVVNAPFTNEQVKSLNGCQQITLVYPITCPSETHDRDVNLVATNAGWVCPDESCEYSQDWAHQFRVDGSWRTMKERWDALFVRRRGRGETFTQVPDLGLRRCLALLLTR